MPDRQCYHCKQMVAEGEPHDCWTTTEAALTRDLSEDLRDAWERLRESAVELGEQRVYASHKSIMFSRRSCYCFVRPKRSLLEVCVFLSRAVNSPLVRKVEPSSRTKFAHLIPITHRDQVEAPLTDWLAEAFELSGTPAAPLATASRPAARPAPATRTTTAKTTRRPRPVAAKKPATHARKRKSPARSVASAKRRKTSRPR